MRYKSIDPELLYIDNFWHCSTDNFVVTALNRRAPTGWRTWVALGNCIEVLIIGKWKMDVEDPYDEALMCVVPGHGLVAIPFISMTTLQKDSIRNKKRAKENIVR